jgi:type IV secretory pathway TrbL component
MFKLLVSNTESNSAIAFLLSGPGMAVLTVGPEGSFVKNGCSVEEGADLTAAAVAYGRRADLAASREAMGRNRAAARRDDMMDEERRGVD